MCPFPVLSEPITTSRGVLTSRFGVKQLLIRCAHRSGVSDENLSEEEIPTEPPYLNTAPSTIVRILLTRDTQVSLADFPMN